MFDARVMAHNIKKYRKLKNLTQNELAEILYVSPQAVSKWECGISVPDIENLCKISKILNIPVDIIIGNSVSDGKIMIGVDGGGSKTEFILFSDNGKILNRIVMGASNPNSCGTEISYNVLKSGIDTLLSVSPGVCGVFMGVSGFSSGNSGRIITEKLRQTYPDIQLVSRSDIINVASAGTDEKNCIAAICGTGCVVYAIENSELHRVGGWGQLIEKEGSGYDIGREALFTSLAQRDGIGEKSLITELTEERLGKSVWESINEIYSKDRAYIASFATVVFAAYENGDRVATDIIERNISRLAFLINSADKMYNCGKTVVLSGGVVQENENVVELLKQKLNSGLKLIIPEVPQVYGACIQCCRMCGVDTTNLKEQFMPQYKSYLQGDKNA